MQLRGVGGPTKIPKDAVRNKVVCNHAVPLSLWFGRFHSVAGGCQFFTYLVRLFYANEQPVLFGFIGGGQAEILPLHFVQQPRTSAAADLTQRRSTDLLDLKRFNLTNDFAINVHQNQISRSKLAFGFGPFGVADQFVLHAAKETDALHPDGKEQRIAIFFDQSDC